MTAAEDRQRVRVQQRGVDQTLVVTLLSNHTQATVVRVGALWQVTFMGVSSRYPTCVCVDRIICAWPNAECYRGTEGVKHIGRQCHGWHAPRATVAATALLIAAADGATAAPPPEGRMHRRTEVLDLRSESRRGRDRFSPRGDQA